MSIAVHDTHTEKADIWSRLAEPLPNGVISWRQDGKVMGRDGKYFARFVAYIEANTARERLDSVVPGEWDLSLELLPPLPALGDGEEAPPCAFKARLQILGCVREDVGSGRDYKAAATDAFKRAAVRFGIAHELYSYEHNWVPMDGDGRNAKPLEDPGVVYARRYGPANGASLTTTGNGEPPKQQAAKPAPASKPKAPSEGTPACPKCGGKVWDNRTRKKNPKAPDYKCRDRSCDGVIWPPRMLSVKEANDELSELGDDWSMDNAPQLDDDSLPF